MSQSLAGRAPKVHVIRGATVYTWRDHGTTYCGLYGRPDPGGWMKPTSDEATCKTCLAAVRREQERP